ncbi:Proteophosphoglycan ppg4 [Rhodotorula toruloides]|uniref:Proteophosphoglycan ppg4 n=1 Tax=Rhodotorula toruloides TaxID=5286 RepID=A0A2T0AAA0_RHOTO|nr:Proteophosphoglycan ppg4 [Rhodotorula toruloides]
MNDTTMTHDTDSPPASEGSTTSWPATEVELSEDVPTPRVTSKEESGTDEGVEEISETAETTTEQPGKADIAADISPTTTDSLATPASPSWSRSRLPVSDDEDAASKVEDSAPAKKEKKAEEGAQQEESGSLGLSMGKEVEAQAATHEKAGDAVAKEQDKEDQPKRPAFVLTRPTVSGENELVTITQPSTPSGSVAGDKKDEDKPDPRNIRITTFLPETKTFFTSPTTTNAIPNSAVSPLTQTFFSTDFSVRSPPRPGGAFITELPSDAEVTVSQAVKITVGEPKPSRPGSRDPSRSRNASPAMRPLSQNRKRIPSPSPVRPPRPHSSSHTRVYRPLSDSDDDTSDARPTHLPFVRGRTVVSAPPLRTAPPGSFKIHRQPPQYSHVPRDPLFQYEEPRRPASREEPRRRPPRQEERFAPSRSTLLNDLKKALKTDPATYYAVKGLLAEHDERKRESRKEKESYRVPEEKRSSAHRHDERRTRHEERPADVFEPRIPVSFAFMTGASGSETEVDKARSLHQDKLRKPVRPTAPSSRSPQPASHDESYKESPRLPTTSHSTKRSDDDRRPHRPIPVRIHHPLSHAIPSPEPPYPSSRDPSPQRFLPRSQTLTMAQAARLAEGLGDRRQADDLRKTGLKSGDKVSLLDERDGGEKLRKKEEKISSGTGNSSKKEKKDGERREEKSKSARRHSFDSVVDYKPSPQSSTAKKNGEPSSSRKTEKPSRSSARKDDPYRSPVHKPVDYRYSTGRPRDTIDRYVASDASSKKGGKGKERAISFDFDDLM